MSDSHFNQKPKRKAHFITPPNKLKEKVGSGGLTEAILDSAQSLLEKHTENFRPLADLYLQKLAAAIAKAKQTSPDDGEEAEETAIQVMIEPAMQLKANGGMFKFPLITEVSDILIHFLEVIDRPDTEAIEIAEAFYTTMRLIVRSEIRQNNSSESHALTQALNDACQRYFDTYPNRVNTVAFD